MTNIISVKNLSVGFQANNKKSNVVHSISFDIPKGKTVALVGESGSGKTVTALSILKLLSYPSAYHESGEINYQNKNLLKISNIHIKFQFYSQPFIQNLTIKIDLKIFRINVI